MNNGLSAFNRSKREQPWVSEASGSRWLMSTLCLASLGAGVFVISAPSALAQAAQQEDIVAPDTEAIETEALKTEPFDTEALKTVAPPQGVTLQNSRLLSQAQSTPEPAAQPTPEPAAQPTPEPAEGLPSIVPDDMSDAPVAEPVPAAPPVANPSAPGPTQAPGANQIPSLPPQVGPRFEPPLIRPNAVTPTIDPSFEAYHLGPGDSIFVSVQRYPDLSFQATLDLQGNVIVPIQGAVNFEGLTLQEAEGLLRGLYNQYVVIREPRDVGITLVGRRGVEVTILGAVERPGFYPLADPSVSTALLTAGGATRTSDLRGIQVQRQLRREGGIVQETVNVDLFTPLKEGGPLPDVRLEDGDVLVIPELDPSQLDEYDSYLVARSTLAQPVINVRFLNYAGGRGGVGTLNLNNGSSFIDAITLLGVNPDNADLGDVALIRYDPETGRAVTISLDAKSAILGDITQDPPLQDNDVVVVGRNLIGRLSFALQTITRPFRDVFGFTRFLDDALNDGLFNNN